MTTKTKKFLQTRSGLLAAHAITMIGPLKTYRINGDPQRPHYVHEISYHVGNQAFETEAEAGYVDDFLGRATADREFESYTRTHQ
jgi:hypothetical protein